MLQSNFYWPRLLLRNSYGVLLLGAITWVTVSAAIRHEKVNWQGIGIVWLVIAAIFAWAIWSARQSGSKALSNHNARSPDYLLITASGVQCESANGATAANPWNVFTSWREGKSLILLFFTAGKQVQILPKTDLSPNELDSLRGTLTALLGPRSTK